MMLPLQYNPRPLNLPSTSRYKNPQYYIKNPASILILRTLHRKIQADNIRLLDNPTPPVQTSFPHALPIIHLPFPSATVYEPTNPSKNKTPTKPPRVHLHIPSISIPTPKPPSQTPTYYTPDSPIRIPSPTHPHHPKPHHSIIPS